MGVMFRPAMILIALLAGSIGLTVFVVKYQVQDMEDQLAEFNRTVTEDRQAVHVLKAEWSYLNEPARLRLLAERYLDLRAIETRQVGTAAEWFPEIPESTPESTDSVQPLTGQVSTEEVTR